jgi:hypothetical protein
MQYGAIYRSRQEEELANSLLDLPDLFIRQGLCALLSDELHI